MERNDYQWKTESDKWFYRELEKRKYSFMTFRFQTKRMITPFIEQITFWELQDLCKAIITRPYKTRGKYHSPYIREMYV